MTTEKKQNENQSSPQNQEAAQTESVTLTPEEKKQELLSVLLEKGKQSKNQLTYTMIADVLENTDLDKNQMDDLYEKMELDDDKYYSMDNSSSNTSGRSSRAQSVLGP